MNELDSLDLASLAARALGAPRCRRYLFDRPESESQDPPVAVDGAAPSASPAPNPLFPEWRDALEHRR